MSANPQTLTKAVIYARVSGAKQVREGDGLASQETRCREYATYKDYNVVEVFTDDMTGKALHRPAIDRMLAFLRLQRNQNIVVIIDDISRLARNIEAHIELRRTISDAGGTLESPSIEFGEDSDSMLVEHMLASVAQHQREKNAEQTRNRMRGRMMNGYWVFQAPIGYRYETTAGHGKLLVRDEPVASIVQDGLEAYAAGRLDSQAELKRFFESQPAFPKDLAGGKIRQQKVTDILNRIVYAGYVEYNAWGIGLRDGHHDGLVSLTTWERIQDRRNGAAKAPTRKDINADFPLRGFVTCNDCGNPYTACWSTSKTGKRHPYYLCDKRGCVSYRKSVRRDVMEGAFEQALHGLKPSEGLFEIIKSMFMDAWDQRKDQVNAGVAELRTQLRQMDKQIEGLLDRIVDSENGTVVAAYEKRIAKLEREKVVLDENLTKTGQPLRSFTDMFELAIEFLSNPWKLWASGQLPLQRTVLKLAFAERISYCRQTGLRTPQPSVPFTFFGMNGEKCKLVPGEDHIFQHKHLNSVT